jgi:hypothetical protein
MFANMAAENVSVENSEIESPLCSPQASGGQ